MQDLIAQNFLEGCVAIMKEANTSLWDTKQNFITAITSNTTRNHSSRNQCNKKKEEILHLTLEYGEVRKHKKERWKENGYGVLFIEEDTCERKKKPYKP